MNALTQAIHTQLAADATLAAYLAAYNGAPAIISADPVPFDLAMPYVVIDPPLHDSRERIKNELAREIHLDIRAYADASGSTLLISDIAERIAVLLHNVILAVTGWTMIVAECINGPIRVPTDPRIMGLAITMRYQLYA